MAGGVLQELSLGQALSTRGCARHSRLRGTAQRDTARVTPRLTIELLPQEQWGANLYQLLQGKRWDTVKKETYRRAGNRCEICGGVGTRVAVQAHEVWEYDEAAGTQRLVRMIALCPACHDAKHFGRAQAGGPDPSGWPDGPAPAEPEPGALPPVAALPPAAKLSRMLAAARRRGLIAVEAPAPTTPDIPPAL